MGRTSSSDADSGAAPELVIKGPSKARFEQVFKEGKRAAGIHCRLTALPGSGRIGIATSKKIGNTPQRNRAKRRFREVLRSLSLDLRPQLDYIVMVLPSGAKAPMGELRVEVGKLADELNRRWAKDLESS